MGLWPTSWIARYDDSLDHWRVGGSFTLTRRADDLLIYFLYKKKPLGPNRSDYAKEDTRGMPYDLGNRHTRRAQYARRNETNEIRQFRGSDKLPKALWVKGKSKFVAQRLRDEKKTTVAELYK